MCLAAVKQNGTALHFVPEELRTHEFYLAAVRINGSAMQFVPKEHRTLDLCILLLFNKMYEHWDLFQKSLERMKYALSRNITLTET